MSNFRTDRMYKILLEGYPDASWADWFSNASFDHSDDGTSLLTVHIPDQPALMGILIRLNSLVGVVFPYWKTEIGRWIGFLILFVPVFIIVHSRLTHKPHPVG